MNNLDKLVESFFKPQPKGNKEVSISELLNLVKEATLLKEAYLSIDDLSKNRYFNALVKKIQDQEPLLLEPKSYGETSESITVDIESEKGVAFLEALIEAGADVAKLSVLFKKGAKLIPVIPATNGNTYIISQLSKNTFTAKITKGGLQGTETPEMKEGLVCFFFLVGSGNLQSIEDKLNSRADTKLDLPVQLINTQYFGHKSDKLVRSAISYLNENQIIDKKEIGLYLNAISAAKACFTFNKNVVDRGKLFESIRKVASSITNVDPDKWCPADIYLYDEASIPDIVSIFEQSLKTKNIISISEKGEIIQVGLNHLFEGETPIIQAVSLKEEEALSGRATAFLQIKNLKGEQLASKEFELTPEERQILKTYKDRTISNADAGIRFYQDQYAAEKAAFKTSLLSYGVTTSEAVPTKAQKIKSKEQQLGNLVSKTVCYRFMSSYLEDFHNLKQANEIMVKYDNPMLALTAFGVGLSGFNPTFNKAVGFSDGQIASITQFKGRDTLEVSSDEALISDSIAKAGFTFSFLTKMGEKRYKTTLDIRFAGGLSVSIIVDEFHEE